jgi:hypothetical protein
MPSFFGIKQIGANQSFTLNVPSNNVEGFIIGNESGYTCVIQLVGTAFTKSLYPGTVDFFAVNNQSFTGTISVQTFSYLTNISAYPGSFLQIDVVFQNEKLPYVFPFALGRVQNVGNTVNTFTATSSQTDTSLVNDTNTAGTQIIEATVSGQGSSAVSVTNDGIWVLGNMTSPGQLSLDNATITSDGAGNMVMNNLTTTGNFTTTSLNIVAGGAATFTNGSKSPIISSFKTFTFTSNGTSNQVITHSLGITPVMIILTNYQNSPTTSEPGLVSFDSTTATFYSVGLSNAKYLGCAIG